MHPASRYIDGVLSGKIVVCRFVRLAVERHVRDLKASMDGGSPYYFDEAAARHAIDFNQFVCHSKGEWAGKVFDLESWQSFIRWCIFGWKRRSDGTRRFREAYIEIARKNGKTTDGASLGNYCLIGDGESGAEVYAAATKRDQARIMHSEAMRMVKASPSLRKRIKTGRDNLHIANSASKFEPLGADADTMDGLNASMILLDELHAHKTRAMVDVLETATGSRRQPLTVYFTTAGYNRASVCWQIRERVRQMLTGTAPDDELFGIIYTLDKKYDWPELLTAEEARSGKKGQVEDSHEDERNWIKANPNLGISVKLDDVRRQFRKTKVDIGALQAFNRYKMNVWSSQVLRWMPMEAWDNSAGPGPILSGALEGLECCAGLDLSARNDLCALVLVFPFRNEEIFKVLPFFWIPRERMLEKVKRDHVHYDVWEQRKLITVTDGNVVDYDMVIETLCDCRDRFNLREIAFDRWGMDRIVQELARKDFVVSAEKEAQGCRIIPFGTGFQSMSEPMKELMNLTLERKLHHGGHPVLRWNADNVVADTNPSEGIKPNKEKSTQRIDGIVAEIMALGRATLADGDDEAPAEAYRVKAYGGA